MIFTSYRHTVLTPHPLPYAGTLLSHPIQPIWNNVSVQYFYRGPCNHSNAMYDVMRVTPIHWWWLILFFLPVIGWISIYSDTVSIEGAARIKNESTPSPDSNSIHVIPEQISFQFLYINSYCQITVCIDASHLSLYRQ